MKLEFIRAFFEHLCQRRWRVQEEEYRHADKNRTQYPIEPTRLFPAYIPDDKLSVPGSKEPVPVKKCRQKGNDARQDKNTLNDVLAHAHSSMVSFRSPFSTSLMVTLIALPGKSSSTSSGHSMKQRAPL